MLSVDPDSAAPRYRQLFEQLRHAIHVGELPAGTRLTPTRALASELGLSRNTVNTAYELLMAEGYVVASRGAGFFVADILPLLLPTPSEPEGVREPARQRISKRGSILAEASRPVPILKNPAFQRGLPALDQFPLKQWQVHLDRHFRRPDPALFKYQDQGGHSELKQALQKYLTLARGVHCEVDQITIVSGGQAALDLIARMLVDEGDEVAIENPGYLGARDALRAAGASLRPVPVDGDGLVVDALPAEAKLVYVTPSHQFPLGMTMSAARRMQLLQWAQASDACIIEDDYDSEFRFRGRPLSSLQGLDNEGRVIYVGTFSKVMFPGLRLGYIVSPRGLWGSLNAALRKTGQDAPLLLQAALADFIHAGQFASHIRRMRNLYRARQQLFVHLASKHLSGWLDVPETDAGMQLPAFFKVPVDQNRLMVLARETGLDIALLSAYCLEERGQQGLLLGYAGIPESQMETNVVALAKVLSASASS